jgi:hypothetical protein
VTLFHPSAFFLTLLEILFSVNPSAECGVYLLINMISLASHKGIWQELPIILPANPPNLPTYYIVLVRLKKWAV